MPVPCRTRLPGISPPHCGLFEILLLFVAEASGHIDLTFLAAPRPLPCGAQAASLRRTSRFLAALGRHRFSRATQTPPLLSRHSDAIASLAALRRHRFSRVTQTPPLLSRHSDATASVAALRRHRFCRGTQTPPLLSRHSDATASLRHSGRFSRGAQAAFAALRRDSLGFGLRLHPGPRSRGLMAALLLGYTTHPRRRHLLLKEKFV